MNDLNNNPEPNNINNNVNNQLQTNINNYVKNNEKNNFEYVTKKAIKSKFAGIFGIVLLVMSFFILVLAFKNQSQFLLSMTAVCFVAGIVCFIVSFVSKIKLVDEMRKDKELAPFMKIKDEILIILIIISIIFVIYLQFG